MKGLVHMQGHNSSNGLELPVQCAETELPMYCTIITEVIKMFPYSSLFI